MSLKSEKLFHQVLSQAKQRSPSEVWGLCVSGGLDSICLLHLMHAVSKITGHHLEVFHIHHGSQGSERQLQFRRQAFDKVSHACIQLNLKLHSNFSQANGRQDYAAPIPTASASEAELRDYRWSWLKLLSQDVTRNLKGRSLVFLTGHHQDDVLETRLIQLIRGTSSQGLAQFRAASPGIWRPLFYVAQLDLASLGARQKWEWIEDPSNESCGPLRNWIRREWLPQLEAKRKGAAKSFHRSLDSIVTALSVDEKPLEVSNRGLLRAEFLALSRQRQLQSLAQLLRCRGVNSFSQGQLLEILKRLGANKVSMQFQVGKLCWKIDKFYIQASRV